ncbi:hypothetical protein DYU05_18990 [Mucilaginibacter terrenus]|uniref:Uncharacterized protein n=1 Tax=Mucilaginibacter terrenus TaxID=2482727 RepID=A0A3E2NK98_9SPHI|nr:hypothetical protein DYU05_18990 [Mucilaginibacter terrenus]
MFKSVQLFLCRCNFNTFFTAFRNFEKSAKQHQSGSFLNKTPAATFKNHTNFTSYFHFYLQVILFITGK